MRSIVRLIKGLIDQMSLSRLILSFDFVLGGTRKKCKCIKNEMLILCLYPATLLKTRLRIWFFLSNFENFFQVFFFLILRNFSACNFVNSKAPVQIFPCEFCKILKNTCCAEHLRRTASNDVIIVRFFCKIYCSLKSKIKKCER